MQPPIAPPAGQPRVTLILAGKAPASRSPQVTPSNAQAPVTPAHLEAKPTRFQALFNRKPGTSSAGEASQPGGTFFTSAGEKLKSLAPFSSAGGPSESSPHTEETNNPGQRKWFRPLTSPSSSRPDKSQRKVADVYCTALRAVLDNKVKKDKIREEVKELTSVTAEGLKNTIEKVATDKVAKCVRLKIESGLKATFKNARRVVIPINGTPPQTLVFKREKTKDGKFTPWRRTDASKWHSISVKASPEDFFSKLASNERPASVNVVIVRKKPPAPPPIPPRQLRRSMTPWSDDASASEPEKRRVSSERATSGNEVIVRKKQSTTPPIPARQISPSMTHFSDVASTPEQLVDRAEAQLNKKFFISAEIICRKALDEIGPLESATVKTLSNNDFNLRFRALQVLYYCQVKQGKTTAAMDASTDLFKTLEKRAPQSGTEDWKSLQAWRYMAARALFENAPPRPAEAVELLLKTKKDLENLGDDCKRMAEYAAVLDRLLDAMETEVMPDGAEDKGTLQSKFNACCGELSESEKRRYFHLRAAFKETVDDKARPHSFSSDSTDSAGSYLTE